MTDCTDRLLGAVVRIRAALAGDRGASLVEYAFLVALIAIVCLAAVAVFGEDTSTSFSTTGNSISKD